MALAHRRERTFSRGVISSFTPRNVAASSTKFKSRSRPLSRGEFWSTTKLYRKVRCHWNHAKLIEIGVPRQLDEICFHANFLYGNFRGTITRCDIYPERPDSNGSNFASQFYETESHLENYLKTFYKYLLVIRFMATICQYEIEQCKCKEYIVVHLLNYWNSIRWIINRSRKLNLRV